MFETSKNVTFFQSKSFNITKDLDKRAFWVTMSVLNSMTTVLIHVKMKEEIGVMWPQAKGYLKPLEGGRSKEGFSLELLAGA
jgi:hypothetical protein